MGKKENGRAGGGKEKQGERGKKTIEAGAARRRWPEVAEEGPNESPPAAAAPRAAGCRRPLPARQRPPPPLRQREPDRPTQPPHTRRQPRGGVTARVPSPPAATRVGRDTSHGGEANQPDAPPLPPRTAPPRLSRPHTPARASTAVGTGTQPRGDDEEGHGALAAGAAGSHRRPPPPPPPASGCLVQTPPNHHSPPAGGGGVGTRHRVKGRGRAGRAPPWRRGCLGVPRASARRTTRPLWLLGERHSRNQ